MTDLRFNIAEAVFASVPRKQPKRNHGFSVRRTITDADLEHFVERGTAKAILDKTAVHLLGEVSRDMAAALVNAGPHVVDLVVRVDYDVEKQSHVVLASTPLLASKTYGPSVARADLHVRQRGETVAPVEPPAPWWKRLGAAIVRAGTEPLKYDGPHGSIDA